MEPAARLAQAARVAVCVCTCQRPQMLRRRLAAISKLTRPGNADLSIIVVDNEEEPNNRAIVEEFGAVYVHEPLRGLSHARNAAVEAALRLNADFVAFTDDDCEPATYWLNELMNVARDFDADVVRGRTVYVYEARQLTYVTESRMSRGHAKNAIVLAPLFQQS